MHCPYCSKEMEEGLITNVREIAWFPGLKRRYATFSGPEDGSVLLSKFSARKGSAVIACLCRDCEKIIIDYADNMCDYNRK